MDPQLITILLLLAGVALIFAELFVPSGGMIAIMCVGCFAGSVYFAYKSWYATSPVLFGAYVASLAVVIPSSMYGAFQLLTKTSLGNRVLLRAPTAEEVTPYQRETARLQAFVGQHGTALSLMTPGGMVLVHGERLHAVADAIMIESGTAVVVTGVDGTRVVVQVATANPTTPHGDASEGAPTGEGDAAPPSTTIDEDSDELNPFV
ncbi:MAG: hypothetical protein KDA58_01195 [Planctomycetaceae bacterium]|nr:hypothetical protein [Planctomycetaceae bacterium]